MSRNYRKLKGFLRHGKNRDLMDISGYYTFPIAKKLVGYVDEDGEKVKVKYIDSLPKGEKKTSRISQKSAYKFAIPREKMDRFEIRAKKSKTITEPKQKPRSKPEPEQIPEKEQKISKPIKTSISMQEMKKSQNIEKIPSDINIKPYSIVKIIDNADWADEYPEPRKTYKIYFQRKKNASFSDSGANGYGVFKKTLINGFKPIKIKEGSEKYDANTHLRLYKNGKIKNVHWVWGYYNGNPAKAKFNIENEKKAQGISK